MVSGAKVTFIPSLKILKCILVNVFKQVHFILFWLFSNAWVMLVSLMSKGMKYSILIIVCNCVCVYPVLAELPPPYTAIASPDTGGVPVINCRVCQSLINLDGKLHQHVVKCTVCNEATVRKSLLWYLCLVMHSAGLTFSLTRSKRCPDTKTDFRIKRRAQAHKWYFTSFINFRKLIRHEQIFPS